MMEEVGKPKCFSSKPFIDAAEILLACDDTLLALKVLDSLPAYFIDYPPPEIASLKREIMKKIATASFYASPSNYEQQAGDQELYKKMHLSLRGQLVLADMKICKDNNHSPRVIDVGPGEFFLPRMLKLHGYEFSYRPVYVNFPSFEFYKEHFLAETQKTHLETSPTIFVATEVIEHLHCEQELRFEMERNCGLADVVHISTPRYTYASEVMDWRTIGDLGHLRTYGPRSFYEVIAKMWPEYDITIYDSQVLHARCVLKTTKLQELKVKL